MSTKLCCVERPPHLYQGPLCLCVKDGATTLFPIHCHTIALLFTHILDKKREGLSVVPLVGKF